MGVKKCPKIFWYHLWMAPECKCKGDKVLNILTIVLKQLYVTMGWLDVKSWSTLCDVIYGRPFSVNVSFYRPRHIHQRMRRRVSRAVQVRRRSLCSGESQMTSHLKVSSVDVKSGWVVSHKCYFFIIILRPAFVRPAFEPVDLSLDFQWPKL